MLVKSLRAFWKWSKFFLLSKQLVALVSIFLVTWQLTVTAQSNIKINNGQETQAPGRIIFHISGFQSNTGFLRAALDRSKTDFLKTPHRKAQTPIENQTATVVFEDLPQGTYAVRVFHDENDNQELDRNFLGIPKEAYGFSNDARGVFGPPSFEEARFEFSGEETIYYIRIATHL